MVLRAYYPTNYDPIVLSHARALLTSDPRGATAYIDADLRDTDTIIREAARTLDFSQPVALMLLAIMHFVGDAEDPYDITAQLVGALAPGSYLVLSHASSDIQAAVVAAGKQQYNSRSAVAVTLRSRPEVTRFFDGTELVGPGVVPLGQWTPGPAAAKTQARLPTYCGLGRKAG